MADVYDRLATWSGGNWALLWLAIYICFAILIAFLTGTEHYRLAKSGVNTKGTITATEPENHRTVRYSYVIGQTNYVGGESVGGGFEQLKIGDPVEVFYVPDEPNISCICDPVAEWSEDKFSTALAPLMFSTFIVIVIASLIRAEKRKREPKRQNP